MANRSSNKAAVPEAKGALDKFKYEVASELGVPLSDGYNGDLTSRQNGSVGGSMVKKMIMLVISLMIIVYALRKRNTCDNVNFFLVKYLYFVVIMTMCLSAIDISHYVYERFWQQNYLIITYLLVNLCAQNKKNIIKETLVFLFFCYWLLENFYILKNYMIFTL